MAQHPTYVNMVMAALNTMSDRKGSSKQAIEKFICSNYQVGLMYKGHLKRALRKGVNSGTLIQTKGKGASGSFKIAKLEKPTAVKTAAMTSAKSVAEKKMAKKVTENITPVSNILQKKPKTSTQEMRRKGSSKKVDYFEVYFAKPK